MNIKGQLEYLVEGSDELKILAADKVEQVTDLELLSKATSKDDTTEYIENFIARTDDGDIKFQITTSVGVLGQEISDIQITSLSNKMVIHSYFEFNLNNND